MRSSQGNTWERLGMQAQLWNPAVLQGGACSGMSGVFWDAGCSTEEGVPGKAGLAVGPLSRELPVHSAQ